jgi:hypothetical protein
MSDTAALRPLGVGDLLDEAFRIYRQNFTYLLSVGLAGFLPVAVFVALVNALGALAAEEPAVILGSAVGGLLSGLVGLLVYNAMNYAVDALRRGRRPPLGELFGQAVGPILPMLGLTIILALVISLLVFTLVGWIWLGVLWCLSPTVLLLERGGVMRALSRSRQLVRGSWWRVFGILLLIWLITFFISFLIAGIGGFIGGFLGVIGRGTSLAVVGAILQALFNAAAQSLSQPFGVAGMVLLYYDQRVRKEGLDLQERAESLLTSEAPAGPA